MEKIAIKRLSLSDLTFFACHFDAKSGTKQKAWNLDKKIFIDQMYPVSWGDSKHNVTLVINGPDASPQHSLERKILRQQKNMRLNGELIHSHDSGKDKYGILSAGDYALMVFKGAPIPTQIDIYLISRNSKLDASLHKEIYEHYDSDFNSHRSMVEVNRDDVKKLLAASSVGIEYPAQAIFDDTLLEDVVQNGKEGLEKLKRRRRGKPVSADELALARAKASETGILGERLVNEYLLELLEAKKIQSYVWESEKNAVAPYDFSAKDGSGEPIVLDVKTTTGTFDTKIHISIAELLYARDGTESYDIYRVYQASEEVAKLRIAKNIRENAKEICRALGHLPAGVTADSVSISPDFLTFGDEKELLG